MPGLISVAVPVPSLDLLTYRVPADLETPARGSRVLVPLGTRTVTGCVVGPAAEPLDPLDLDAHAAALRDVVDVLDAEPFLPEDVLELTLWVAEYYMCGPGEAVAAAMPPRAWVQSERRVQITEAGAERLGAGAVRGARAAILESLRRGRPVRLSTLATDRPGRRVGPRRRPHAMIAALERDGLVRLSQPLTGKASAFKLVRIAALTAQGFESDTGDGAEPVLSHVEGPILSRAEAPRGVRQREALQILRGAPEGLDTGALAARGITSSTLRRLRALGLVTLRQEPRERDPWPADGEILARVSEPLTLTAEQESTLRSLDGLAMRGGFHAALLHGVTGSGKTEVYLRLARTVSERGRRALILVPEIALTPAVAAAFQGAFGGRVAIQHSGLSDGERHDQWHRIRRGDVAVVVGTRSAVFAPLDALGLIVVDEEHDGSYKQEESPRYHGRDVAVMRAKRAGALVILGSATPSLESYHNTMGGRYLRLALERRVLDRPLAAVRVVNMRDEYAAAGPDVILSAPLQRALAERLARREQALVLLNRRGYAVAVFCRQCAGTLECPNCSVSLTVHRASRRARCHYCNYSTAVPRTCPVCAGPYLEQIGFGTERVEAAIHERFPDARVARLDRDTARRRGAAAALLARVARGDVDVLVGTQMIAKGHDFPAITLVGVISADIGLGLADFRAAERTFQLLTQVAGRAGRGVRPGEAIIQTLYPEHYSIRHACSQDYPAFFADEIKYRRAMRYPPIVALVNVVVRGHTFDAAMTDAADLVTRLRAGSSAFRVLGPAPAPIGKLRGEYRAQFFLKGSNRTAMRQALRETLTEPDVKRRVIIDVDPINVL